jgi:ubiquinone biosynthesis protein
MSKKNKKRKMSPETAPEHTENQQDQTMAADSSGEEAVKKDSGSYTGEGAAQELQADAAAGDSREAGAVAASASGIPGAELTEKLRGIFSKERVRMKVEKKTRGAEIMSIFAAHNFYAGGLTPVELRTTLEDLGPTYVKIGQIMSSRTDLLPESYCDELVKLRQSVQPLEPELARAVIEQETGKKIEEIYKEFRDEPLGSASIGQVHYGVLKDGTRVVTKVQRPFIVEMTDRDFELLKKLGSIVNVVAEGDDSGSSIDLLSVVEELEKVTKEELDFTNEANNTRLFREKCIDDHELVDCPVIIDELTTKKILTMTYVDGYSISHKDRIVEDGYDPNSIGERILKSYVHQVLDVGIFHADPHQGNIMLSDGKPVWIDFGMLGSISDTNMSLVSSIVLGVIQGDTEALASAAMSVGKPSERTDKSKLMQDLDSFLERYMTGTSIADVDIDEMFMGFSDLVSKNYITLPAEFTMLLRSLAMIEGVIEELCPQLNLFKILSDKFLEREKKNFDLKKTILDAGAEALSMGKKAARIPGLCADVLKDVAKGNMKVNLVLTGYDPLLKSLQETVMNIILAVFACVIFFGSCILCLANVGPRMVGDIPLFAFVGFLFSISLGIYSIKRMTKS